MIVVAGDSIGSAGRLARRQCGGALYVNQARGVLDNNIPHGWLMTAHDKLCPQLASTISDALW